MVGSEPTSGDLQRLSFITMLMVHGSPEQHIWTFAAGTWENYTGDAGNHCPCDNNIYYKSSPGFIGEDYFCESGYVHPG